MTLSLQFNPNLFGNLPINLRNLPLRLYLRDRRAGVRCFAHDDVQRNFAEEWNAEFFGLVPRAAVAENIAAFAAVWAQEITHILDDAEHRHFDALEHFQALARIDQRDVL